MAAASEVDENSNAENSEETKVLVGKSENKIKLSELRVQDLKAELDKRDLDKTGIKSVLLERLKNALRDEGEDPEKFTFEVNNESLTNKSVMKKKKENSVEINGDVNTKESNIDSKEDLYDSIEVDIKDEVIDDICDEVKNNNDEVLDKNVDNDDKCSSNEVTLQLSIDEEDAQLNDDENLLEISKSDKDDVSIKSDKNLDKANEQSLKFEEGSLKSVSSKQAKSNEDHKESKKLIPVSKGGETSSIISPKILKALGKNDKMKNLSNLAKSLWITGLPGTTRAADLKVLFSKQGRVLSVRIVKSTKQTPGKCYGFVTMATSKDASKAIQNLHRTELNGRTISVERTQNEPSVLLKKSESKVVSPSSKKQSVKKEVPVKNTDSAKSSVTSERKVSKKDQEQKVTEVKAADSQNKYKDKSSEKSSEKSRSKEKERKSRFSKERDRRRPPPVRRPPVNRSRPFSFHERPRFGASRRAFAPRPYRGRNIRPSFTGARSSQPSSAAYSLQKIREERLRLRAERELERRRLEEITRHRFIERKQREEAYRLEREKEKLRLEREMLERERAEILKLEREKQRLERERLEREREELRRQSELRRSVKRPASRLHNREPEQYWESKKKIPRYEASTSFPSEPSTSSSRYEYPAKERPVIPRHEYDRRSERYPKAVEPSTRVGYENRESRREVTIRPREERQVFDRNVFRADRDQRPSFQERERHSSSKREAPRMDWKHDRRVHERVVPSSSNSTARRMYY